MGPMQAFHMVRAEDSDTLEKLLREGLMDSFPARDLPLASVAVEI